MSYVVCREEKGELYCIDAEDVLKEYIASKLKELLRELVEQYEIEITLEIKTGKGVAKFRKKE
jgi:hypothetical protein